MIDSYTKLHRLFLIAIFIITLFACSSNNNAPADIKQAAAAVKQMTSPRLLSKSMFSAMDDKITPSDYVEYFFSTLGTSEWPVAMEFSEEELKAAGFITLPRSVLLTANSPNPNEEGHQLVLSADNANSLLIVTGYVSAKENAVLRHAWKFTKVDPAPGVREILRSNKELGM